MDNYEIYGWAETVKRFWTTVTDLLTFVFAKLIVQVSESLLNVLLSSFVLIAPAPNAISVYSLVQDRLGYEWYTAIAFSAAVEFGPFVMIAISLMLFDGLLRKGKSWLIPFVLSVVGTVVVVAVIMLVVYKLDTGNDNQQVMALLPVISICAFVAMAALAWHKVQPEVIAEEAAEADRKRQLKMHQTEEDMQHRLLVAKYTNEAELLAAQHTRRMEKLGVKPADRKAETAKPQNLAQTAKPQTVNQPENFAVATVNHTANTPMEPATGGANYETQEDKILRLVAQTANCKVGQVAQFLTVSKPTAQKILREMASRGELVESKVGQSYVYNVSESYNREAL